MTTTTLAGGPPPPQDRAGPPSPTGRRRRGRAPGSRTREALWGYAFVAPTVAGLGVFFLWPLVRTGYLSFTTWGAFGRHVWSGAANYTALPHDPELRQALVNTVAYTVLVLLGVPLAMVFAALLGRPGLRGGAVYRTLFFLPVVTMQVAVGMVWRWLYNGQYGLINQVLATVGIHGPDWATDPDTALYAMAAVGIWSCVGYQVIVFLAAMSAVPREVYEAAELDGAGPVRQFVSVTVPLLSPAAFFVSVTSVIGSLQLFDLVYVMTGSDLAARADPAFPRIESVVQLFYTRAFVTNDRGYAAAVAMGLLVFIAAVTALQFRLHRRWTDSD
jgi:multiple sugar transport system permease protein